jgi:hypothetical protein
MKARSKAAGSDEPKKTVEELSEGEQGLAHGSSR